MKHILFIVGSFRKDSFNQVAANFLATQLEGKANVSFLDYKDVPFFNQDTEFPTPEAVVKVREQLKAADALWIVSPEYNASIPAVLKNVLDWISRSDVPGTWDKPDYVLNKPVAISGVAGGSKAAGARGDLVKVLERANMNPMPQTVGVSVPGSAFATGKVTIDEIDTTEFVQQVEDFLAFIEA